MNYVEYWRSHIVNLLCLGMFNKVYFKGAIEINFLFRYAILSINIPRYCGYNWKTNKNKNTVKVNLLLYFLSNSKDSIPHLAMVLDLDMFVKYPRK